MQLLKYFKNKNKCIRTYVCIIVCDFIIIDQIDIEVEYINNIINITKFISYIKKTYGLKIKPFQVRSDLQREHKKDIPYIHSININNFYNPNYKEQIIMIKRKNKIIKLNSLYENKQ